MNDENSNDEAADLGPMPTPQAEEPQLVPGGGGLRMRHRAE